MNEILVIEDEQVLNENLKQFLSAKGYRVTTAATKREAQKALELSVFDLILSDLRLPDVEGTELIELITRVAPDSIVLVMTAFSSLDTALEVFHCGAHDYIIKPFSLSEIEHKIANALQYKQLLVENSIMRQQLQLDSEAEDILMGRSQVIVELNAIIRRVATARCTVLINGESGTGKDLVAQAIHRYSPNQDGLYVPVNVAAIPEGLVESYLFGHVKGAFTGANQAREGAFRMACRGTLFLDEIGEMPLQTQSKLLRVLESNEVLPVGSDIPVEIDTRIVAATNRNLKEMVEAGTFREDLWYRLNVFNLRTPPLRERLDDIPELVCQILSRLQLKLGKPIFNVDNDVMHYLMAQPWKGNIRELRNLLERAAVLCDDSLIHLKDLMLDEGEITIESSKEIEDLSSAVEAFKARHIIAALKKTGGCRETTAKLLGLSPSTLYRQMDKLGLKGYQENRPSGKSEIEDGNG